MSKIGTIVLFTLLLTFQNIKAQEPVFRNPDATINERVGDLLHELTLEEKISLFGFNSPGVERLKIPAYNWWNEALHGIARGGEATVFPQAIGLAATFNDSLAYRVSTAISTEARAKFNLTTQMDRHMQYMGLTFWTPNINIFRDPRWGRGQETYGEDPFLTATMGSAFVKGLQGTDPHYLKAAACAKHFAVHSGPEAERHQFNVVVDEKDLRETYLYAFKKLVDSDVEAVMCAYNRVNSEPCCTGKTLLQDILRNEWQFKGHVVTDCWALEDIWLRHKAIPTSIEVAAAAIKAGVNLDCSNLLQDDVTEAINKGLLTETDINSALTPNLHTQMKLGFFDPPSLIPFRKYGTDSVHNSAHIALAREVAEQSMVLLKNNGILPLSKEKYASIMVTGENASSMGVLVGSYHGVSGNMVTFIEGIVNEAGPALDVQYDKGCISNDTVHFGGIWAATGCDLTIAVIGLSPLLEGEDGDAFLSTSHGDKVTLSLPKSHLVYLKKLKEATKKPLVVVVTAGSAVDLSEIEPLADAIILTWYPGEQGGTALADILFGKVSPSGRLPVTFYKSLNDVPDYRDYGMKERTYRYFSGNVQYPFGFGLSYTTFNYEWISQPKNTYIVSDTLQMSVRITNTGNYDGADVLQAYIQYPNLDRMPLKELKAFRRVNVLKGKTIDVTLSISLAEIQKWDLNNEKWKTYQGQYIVCIGRNSNDFLLKKEFLIK